MSINKNVFDRMLIVDECLRDKRRPDGYRIEEIMEKCNKRLADDEREIYSRSTIHNDIKKINEIYSGGETVKNRLGRYIYHRYIDQDFTINENTLTSDEFAKLEEALNIINQIKGIPHSEWFDEMKSRLKNRLRFSKKASVIISFDDNPNAIGGQYISELFDYISKKETVQITYKPYFSSSIEYTFSPYFLKEYLNRWFIIGQTSEYDELSIFALDRIESINLSSAPYISSNIDDFTSYFEDIIGVTKESNREKEIIELRVSKTQYPYIKSKPIHKSQLELSSCKDGSAIISIEVAQNYELFQKLLSYGTDVTVLKPADLREKLKQEISLMAKCYE